MRVRGAEEDKGRASRIEAPSGIHMLFIMPSGGEGKEAIISAWRRTAVASIGPAWVDQSRPRKHTRSVVRDEDIRLRNAARQSPQPIEPRGAARSGRRARVLRVKRTSCITEKSSRKSFPKVCSLHSSFGSVAHASKTASRPRNCAKEEAQRSPQCGVTGEKHGTCSTLHTRDC